MKRTLFLLAALLTMTELTSAAGRPMTLDDLYALKRVADPQVSPDGKQVVYQVTEITDVATNKKHTHLWLADTDGKTKPRQLTSSGKSDTHPRWNPDGTKILFESNRGGSSQLYILDLKAGGEAVQITTISTGASNAIWSRDSGYVAFVSAVYPEFSELDFKESDAKNKVKAEAIEGNIVKAKTFTKLFYRHWDEYVGDKRQHLFVMQVGPSNQEHAFDYNWRDFLDSPRDITPGDRDAYPTSTTFGGGDDFCFTPDTKSVIFTAVPKKDEAWSTNYELCKVGIWNKSKVWPTLTEKNLAADSGPKLSPDGHQLAWRAQKKAGYEADKWDVLTVQIDKAGAILSEPKNLTAGQDVSVNEFAFLDNVRIAFTADFQGATPIFESDGAKITQMPYGGMNGSLSVSRSATFQPEWLVFTNAGMDRPADVLAVNLRDVSRPNDLSKANEKLLGSLDRPRPESVTVKVEDGEMQMWLLKPPGFVEGKKYPVVYLIHGGPQGAWEDGWSWRWNPTVWAAQGYVIAMPNPRGSTGFGQKFVDQIAGDWGGKCYRDLVAGLEAVKALPYVDKDRIGSAGASFGGYMQNWFAVNDIAKDLKCQINHCSVWNFESMWGTTDELWFDEWEHGGLPWEKPGKYAEFSPHKRAGELGKNKVPMLIIHNDLDFRCPIGQGHELFTALQRQGVPSRFVNFPDECHWVLKPANSKHWHNEVFGWLKQHLPPGAK